MQGFPNMMKAEKYVVDNHLAHVISQSFASAEDAFGSAQSLENLRYAFKAAAANGVTVLGSSGDGGTANGRKTPVRQGRDARFPFPTVEWPASDPLVTGVGGTYLCTNPLAGTNDPRTPDFVPGRRREVRQRAFNPSTISPRSAGRSRAAASATSSRSPPTRTALPAGSTAIGSMRGVPDVAFQASAGTGRARVPVAAAGRRRLERSARPAGTTSAARRSAARSGPGLVAIADQINGGGLGLINPALYKIGANPTRYAADFFDVRQRTTRTRAIPPSPATRRRPAGIR